MIPGPLDFVPLWAFFVVTAALAVLGLEVGYRLGRWRHACSSEEKEAPVGAMVGSILGLLAIMLAFTFNLAASRFDARRQTILLEANAVGTAYLRAQLLPESEQSKVAELLREYVAVRIRSSPTADAMAEVNEGIARSEELHRLLWEQATAAARKNPESIMTGLFVQSLNEVIDLHAQRVMVGLHSRIPLPMWLALFSLALLGMFSMGYQAGLSATRRSPAELLLAAAFAGVLFLIVDLDRAHEGAIKISQQALIDLQKNMAPPGG